MNHTNYSEIESEFAGQLHKKSLPFMGAGDKQQNSTGLPITHVFLLNYLTICP